MEPAVLGLALDSSVAIRAERARWSADDLFESIQTSFGDIELSISPIALAELVHGIYRAHNSETAERRREFVERLIELIPVHPVTSYTAWRAGRLRGEEAAKGNVLPFADLLIAVGALEQGYAVLTNNVRHFAKIPGVRVVTF